MEAFDALNNLETDELVEKNIRLNHLALIYVILHPALGSNPEIQALLPKQVYSAWSRIRDSR